MKKPANEKLLRLPKYAWILVCSHGYTRESLHGPTLFRRKPAAITRENCVFKPKRVKLEPV